MIDKNANYSQNTNVSQLAYSVRQVSELTTLSKMTILRLIDADKLKARKVGRRTLIRHADLENFLNQQEETANV